MFGHGDGRTSEAVDAIEKDRENVGYRGIEGRNGREDGPQVGQVRTASEPVEAGAEVEDSIGSTAHFPGGKTKDLGDGRLSFGLSVRHPGVLRQLRRRTVLRSWRLKRGIWKIKEPPPMQIVDLPPEAASNQPNLFVHFSFVSRPERFPPDRDGCANFAIQRSILDSPFARSTRSPSTSTPDFACGIRGRNHVNAPSRIVNRARRTYEPPKIGIPA